MRVRTRAGGSGHAPTVAPPPPGGQWAADPRRLASSCRSLQQEFLRASFLHLKATHASAAGSSGREEGELTHPATQMFGRTDEEEGRVHLQIHSSLE